MLTPVQKRQQKAIRILKLSWNRTSLDASAARLLVSLASNTLARELENEEANKSYWWAFADAVERYLKNASELTLFHDVMEILQAGDALPFNSKILYANFEKLWVSEYLYLLPRFSDDFHGEILQLHEVGKYAVIETTKYFYPVSNITCAFEILDEALVCEMFPGKHLNSVMVLFRDK